MPMLDDRPSSRRGPARLALPDTWKSPARTIRSRVAPKSAATGITVRPVDEKFFRPDDLYDPEKTEDS